MAQLPKISFDEATAFRRITDQVWFISRYRTPPGDILNSSVLDQAQSVIDKLRSYYLEEYNEIKESLAQMQEEQQGQQQSNPAD